MPGEAPTETIAAQIRLVRGNQQDGPAPRVCRDVLDAARDRMRFIRAASWQGGRRHGALRRSEANERLCSRVGDGRRAPRDTRPGGIELDGREHGVEYVYFIKSSCPTGNCSTRSPRGSSARNSGANRSLDTRPDYVPRPCGLRVDRGERRELHGRRQRRSRRGEPSDEEQLADRLIFAKRHVAPVRGNLLASGTDTAEDARACRTRLQQFGVWSNDPVPMSAYPGSSDYTSAAARRTMWLGSAPWRTTLRSSRRSVTRKAHGRHGDLGGWSFRNERGERCDRRGEALRLS